MAPQPTKACDLPRKENNSCQLHHISKTYKMIDPLTASSLAGTIVQFVDFGRKLLADGRELYKSNHGSLTVNDELRLITADLTGLVEKLRGSMESTRCSIVGSDPATMAAASPRQYESDKTLEALCDKAATLAEELSARLEKLHNKGTKGRKWDSIQQSVKNAWSRDEIAGLNRRLSTFKDALETHILFSLRETLDERSLHDSKCFQNLDDQSQLILTTLVKSAATYPEILSTIAMLASRLEVVNRNEHKRTRDLIIGELRSRNPEGGVECISAGIEMLDVSPAQERNLRIRVEETILDNLWYDNMTSRYEGILEAHQKTFEWAFDPSISEQTHWTNLGEWLKNGKGVYWISGKAGSGKSTLMKHLFEDPRTEGFLDEWARGTIEPAPLCTATFFFWNSGSSEQKSQAGLYRALLWQILEKHPDLISIVLPELWAREYAKHVSGKGASRRHESWSLRTLLAAFKAIIEQNAIPLKISLFIDGLDEYDGDHEEISQFFRNVAASPNSAVKACVSSRPWPVFRECFASCPSLRLQDLTSGDIELYISDRMLQNSAFQRLAKNDRETAHVLVNETVEKAEGVFLWVRLAVKSLLNGISNHDTIMDLQRRLQSTPAELEPLYELIFDRIEPVYLSWASRAFQIIRAWGEISNGRFVRPTSSLSLPFNEISDPEILAMTSAMTLEELLLAMNDEITFETAWDGKSNEHSNAWQELEIHLSARCAGLLEVANPELETQKEACHYSTVQYLHQTARNFLEDGERWNKLLACTFGSNFNPYYSILKARAMSHRAQVDIQPVASSSDESNKLAAVFMAFVYQLDTDQRAKVSRAVIEEGLSWGMSYSLGLRGRAKEWSQLGTLLSGIYAGGPSFNFLCSAAELGLSDYVKQMLMRWNATGGRRYATGLLWILLSRDGKICHPLHVDMISTLLQLGACPNWNPARKPGEVYIRPTTWQHFLLYGTRASQIKDISIHQSYVLAMKLLLQAGADPGATIWWDVELLIPRIVGRYISIFPECPDEGAELFSTLRYMLSLLQGGEQTTDDNEEHAAFQAGF